MRARKGFSWVLMAGFYSLAFPFSLQAENFHALDKVNIFNIPKMVRAFSHLATPGVQFIHDQDAFIVDIPQGNLKKYNINMTYEDNSYEQIGISLKNLKKQNNTDINEEKKFVRPKLHFGKSGFSLRTKDGIALRFNKTYLINSKTSLHWQWDTRNYYQTALNHQLSKNIQFSTNYNSNKLFLVRFTLNF